MRGLTLMGREEERFVFEFEWSSVVTRHITVIIIMRQYRKVEWMVRLTAMSMVTNTRDPTAREWREPDKMGS